MCVNYIKYSIVLSSFIISSMFASQISIPGNDSKKYPSGIEKKDGKTTIHLGFTAPLGGAEKNLGRDISTGINIVFDNINQNKKIPNTFLDFQIEPNRNRRFGIKNAIQVLLKTTSLLFGIFGSEALNLIPSTILSKVLFLFPIASAMKFRKQNYKTMFFLRASIADEIEALVTYIVSHKLFSRIAVFYEDSLWGRDGLKYVKHELNKLGKEVLVSACYRRNTVNVVNAIKKIVPKRPDAVIIIGHARSAYYFILEMLNRDFRETIFLGVSETSLVQENLRASRGIQLITTSVVPNPWKSDLPIAIEYRNDIKNYMTNFSIFSFEGYIMAKALVKCLEQCPRPFSKENIMIFLNSGKLTKLGGLNFKFDPYSRSYSHAVWMNTGKNKTWNIFNKKTSYQWK